MNKYIGEDINDYGQMVYPEDGSTPYFKRHPNNFKTVEAPAISEFKQLRKDHQKLVKRVEELEELTSELKTAIQQNFAKKEVESFSTEPRYCYPPLKHDKFRVLSDEAGWFKD